MNDEIKEILEELENMFEISELKEQVNNINKIKDYITNLQQDNEMYAQLKDEYEQEIKDLQQENERLKELVDADNESYDIQETIINRQKSELLEQEDYKSRCEKASEYNNQVIKDTKDFYRPTTDIIYSGDCLIDIAKNNINILQNGSDSQ